MQQNRLIQREREREREIRTSKKGSTTSLSISNHTPLDAVAVVEGVTFDLEMADS